MKNIVVALFGIALSLTLHAQYYYQDIIGTRDLNKTIRLYLDNKVKGVEASGQDENGQPTADFHESHLFYPDLHLLKISNRNKSDTGNETYKFNSKGLLTTISDSSSTAISTTTYEYDDKDNPVIIKNVVSDASDSVYENEVHQWKYNADGSPTSMLRIVNGRDTTDVHFSVGDKGNVIDETPFVRKVGGEKTYYYYDDQNRLTDIVRYNKTAKRLLPDYMFEYTADNQVSQKITTLSAGGVGYIIWRYGYDAKGLKTAEASFNKNKELLGKIKYAYQFN